MIAPPVTQLLFLLGHSALSPFRLNKLRKQLQSIDCRPTSIAATVLYAAEATAICDDEKSQLQHILGDQTTYCETTQTLETQTQLLVFPRLGTISPWSSKATDIVRQCGLASVVRIERGILWKLEGLTDSQRIQASPLLFDCMTESLLSHWADISLLFTHTCPAPLVHIPLLSRGKEALLLANRNMGLALSTDEQDYLFDHYRRIQRDPTDAELMMFAQANSEHCRHKIFNADWVIDGERQDHSLFAMIRYTHQMQPEGTLVAYSDNSSVIKGNEAAHFYPSATDTCYRIHTEDTHILMKVETHNHPTAISPFAGAATGAGGEIRDEGATGIGSKPKAGLCGFTVSNLHIPDFEQAWEHDIGKPARLDSALNIMLQGPIGAAAFNNEFGRPNLCGYFRSYAQTDGREIRGYHKPIMIAGGMGNIHARDVHKKNVAAGSLIIQLGGPAMLIGLGGGAASSMDAGSNSESLDFDSVQRGNPEMERRCQEVLDRCVQMGDANPILFIHDIGAGGLSNAVPELVHDAGRGASLELRAVHNAALGMSPMQIWCNEAQERYVLAIADDKHAVFAAICKRERCPFAVLGTATDDENLSVNDTLLGEKVVDMPLSVLLGKTPQMVRNVQRRSPASIMLPDAIELSEAIDRVLHLPAVASKSFLITIADRSVTGLVARDQMVGPWQVPVADVAVTCTDFEHYHGEAMCMGERTPIAVLNAPASGRMAVAEALTNLAAAPIIRRQDIKLSANWMAACGHPGEDAALYDTVRAVGLEFCPALGLSIPVGKDSLSMKTVWQQEGTTHSVVSPVSLIVSAFAPVHDVRRTLTPQLQDADSSVWLIDLGQGKNRLGGSALAQVFSATAETPPDIDSPTLLAACFDAVQALNAHGLILAYHDRSDGGVFVSLCEMAFAGNRGLRIELPCDDAPIPTLFNEEAGVLLQVSTNNETLFLQQLDRFFLRGVACRIAKPCTKKTICIRQNNTIIYETPLHILHQHWAETSYRMAALRDDPDCAREAFEAIANNTVDNLFLDVHFTPFETPTTAILHQRPRIAVLREQGVNGQTEMAAAFDRAGFACTDVHMSDIITGHLSLDSFQGLVACGGFSYGDVLGAGRGWANSILHHAHTLDAFSHFFARPDTFGLGVCNGCQMMARLKSIIDGAAHWPVFERNRSEQFEARLLMVHIPDSPSLFMQGMADSRLPLVVAHGEGRVHFEHVMDAQKAHTLLHYIKHTGEHATTYPANPNGSPDGAAGFTTDDGRFSIMMPHPERLFRSIQYSWLDSSWHKNGWQEDGPWMQMFRNARHWVA
ncbi:MAG: phosphoribosylformylglycinamidine synthase [Mariprofundaceae bacterium]|nr:phosphoribosylformylglycinamidine synthase [Mariprofundaceae bacterium]